VIVYSVTVTVDEDTSVEWLDWMTSAHIPDVLNTGYFRASQLRRVLEPAGPEGTETFVIEYECESLEHYRAYQREAAAQMQRDHAERYGDRVSASRRIMETAG
jgi:hypothetical protein